MVDVFEEVEEQLRSVRYQTIIQKGWPYLAGAVVAILIIVGGVWGWRSYQQDQAARASESYQHGLDAEDKGDNAGAQARFAETVKTGAPGYTALALMQEAGLASNQHKTAEAVALLDQAAAAAKDPIVGDIARLKAAYALFDTISLADLEARLKPLTQTGRPYVALAREALAMKQLMVGQTAAAKNAFAVLAITPDGGEGLQTRAQIALAAIATGQTANLDAIVKAAAALPPGSIPPPAPPAVDPTAPPTQAGAAQ